MHMPQISVIVPVYNVEKYLHRCVDSILAQTFTDFELILVDDGSPDHCGAICDEYAQRDKRIKAIHKKNGGVSSARNTGIAASTGEYLVFIDSDDYISENFINNLVLHPSDITICGFERRNEADETLAVLVHVPRAYYSKEQIDYAGLYRQFALFSPYCKLFCRQIVYDNRIRFPEQIKWGEDGMFVADYLQYVNSMRVIEETGYYYIEHEDKETLSTRIDEGIIDTIMMAREYCIEKAALHVGKQFEDIKAFCTEDIRQNCAFFVNKAICSRELQYRKRRTILAHYCHNPYVKQIMKAPEEYFPDNRKLQECLKKKLVILMLADYDVYCISGRLKRWVYLHICKRLPINLRNIFRLLRNKARRRT